MTAEIEDLDIHHAIHDGQITSVSMRGISDVAKKPNPKFRKMAR